MADHPTLFSGPMICALLEGRKTQTRRILKVPSASLLRAAEHDGGQGLLQLSRFAKADRLWCRELLRKADGIWRYDADKVPAVVTPDHPRFADMIAWTDRKEASVCPGIHMPRWASRLTLIVTDVRVERLQDISEADAIAEGIEDVTAEVAPSDKSLRFWRRYRDGGWNGYVNCPIGSYASLWSEINGPGSWAENPWAVAVSFAVERRNIDAREEVRHASGT